MTAGLAPKTVTLVTMFDELWKLGKALSFTPYDQKPEPEVERLWNTEKDAAH